MQKTPRISVLMAVFNGAGTVGDAIASVLAQRFSDFELVIVNDGSIDATAEILNQVQDERLRIVSAERNLGLSGALNCGMELLRGEFVARMDADDVCLPERFARQIAYLEGRRDVAVVGSFVQTFAENAAEEIIKYPTRSDAVSAGLLFRSVLAHPTVMWRRAALDSLRYDEEFKYAQDYTLWMECLKRGLKLANVGEVLLKYRVHGGQLSASMDRMQGEGTVIRSRFLQWFVDGVTDEELLVHEGVSRDFLISENTWLESAIAWLEKLAGINERRNVFDHEGLLRALTGRYVALVRFARNLGIDLPVSQMFKPYVLPDAM